MKTLIFKSLLIVGIVLGGVNYLIYLNTGKTLTDDLPNIDISSLLPSKATLKEIPSQIVPDLDLNNTSQSNADENQLYKWTDSEGNVHYSSEEPTNTKSVQEIAINPNTNVVKRIKTKPKEKNNPVQTLEPKPDPTPLDIQTYSPETIEKLINDAKEVQTLMDERTRQIEKAID